MKLPNGYGSVYKLSGNRRRPWAARKTTGYNDKGQPIYVFVGYYRTRAEALQGLSDFNGYALSSAPSKTSLRCVYEAMRGDMDVHYVRAWPLLEELHDVPMRDLTLSRMQAVFDRCDRAQGTQKYMKMLLGRLFDYAVKYEMIRPEKAAIVSYITVTKEKKREIPRAVFTSDEVAKLWKMYETDAYASIPLILLYTGLRIDELLSMRSEDVTDVFDVKKSKTAAGIRTVPIVSRIRPIVDRWKENKTPYLLSTKTGAPMTYPSLIEHYWSAVSFGHRTHDCRHTVATKLAEAGVDDRVVRAVLGHAGTSTAEAVYTHLGDDVKREALERIRF